MRTDLKKNMLCCITLFSLFVITAFISCEEDTPDVISKRPIGLDKSEFNISAQGEKIEIHTQEKGWSIRRATERVGDETKINENQLIAIDNKYDFKKELSGNWYTITQTGEYDLLIEVSENGSGKPRKLVVTLDGVRIQEANISITQK